MTRPHASLARGITLIEVLVGIAILAILLATAVPPFVQTIARMRLEGAVNGLAIDLQYARSEAIRRRTPATLAMDAGNASYTLSYLDAASGNQVTLKTVSLPTDVTLTATGSVVFDSLRGVAAAQTFTGSSSRTSAQLQVQMNALGRLQTCTPSGSFKGYPTC